MSLTHKILKYREDRIWAASYDSLRDAFRVALENGHIYLLQRPIPEDDHSEILDVVIEGDGEVFTVIQATGNEFSVPWDVLEKLAIGEKSRQDTTVGKRVGQRIKALRKMRGMTQAELSSRSGVKRPNISRLEAGKHVPGMVTLQRLADSLDVPISNLIADR